ncbi:MAG: M23 family metallopeptidase [Marinilabiliaceae bacterium]|nr:M23 family metallopeptidase [Marinilabiliaceae bacterium]
MKVKYVYNSETLSYHRVKRDIKYYLSQISLFTASSLVLGVLIFFLFLHFFDSPKERKLLRENSRLIAQYEILNQKFDQVQLVLEDVQLRDENIYRIIYQADSIPNAVRLAGFGGVNRYDYLENLDNADLVVHTSKKLDIIMNQLYVQSKSFDEIASLAQRHEEMLRSIPAILPIAGKDWLRKSSGFGWRIDPHYKTQKMHYGIDYPAHPGTNVFTTGDGVVDEIKVSSWGFGKHIIINHGFGYKTIYAHLTDFNVYPGQKVKRGDIIGFVGSTGKSTSPHLHYEVHVKGIPVNPEHYVFMDITDQQFEEMIKFSSINNQAFD